MKTHTVTRGARSGGKSYGLECFPEPLGKFLPFRRSNFVSGLCHLNGTDPNSGNFQAYFGPAETLGYLSQTISTTAGTLYDLNFFLAVLGGGESEGPNAIIENEFEVFWDGQLIFDSINLAEQPYSQSTFAGLLATGSSTELKFGFFNSPSYFLLDDVSVDGIINTVPEGISTLWLALPLLGMVGWTKLRGKNA